MRSKVSIFLECNLYLNIKDKEVKRITTYFIKRFILIILLQFQNKKFFTYNQI